ncbi:hypothetical protein X946_5212 [Burkholderia sp. ABCPW 111]|nr:hypothetical protein X946_5212 [Burkholderia sp. ABCPW 111]
MSWLRCARMVVDGSRPEPRLGALGRVGLANRCETSSHAGCHHLASPRAEFLRRSESLAMI